MSSFQELKGRLWPPPIIQPKSFDRENALVGIKLKWSRKRDELISQKIYPCDHLVLHQGMALYY